MEIKYRIKFKKDSSVYTTQPYTMEEIEECIDIGELFTAYEDGCTESSCAMNGFCECESIFEEEFEVIERIIIK